MLRSSESLCEDIINNRLIEDFLKNIEQSSYNNTKLK